MDKLAPYNHINQELKRNLDIDFNFNIQFEYELFQKFCSWMEQIFVLKSFPFDYISSDYMVILNDFGAYEANIINDDLYHFYKLFNKQIRFAFYYYDNVLTITYFNENIPGKLEQFVINKPFNYKLNKNSFIVDPYSRKVKLYDVITERFVNKEYINDQIPIIGKYNVRYNDLKDNEIRLFDKLIDICKNNIYHPENINCKEICNYLMNNNEIYAFDSYEDNNVYIVNNNIDLKIKSDTDKFFIEYNRIRTEYMNGFPVKFIVTFYLDYCTKSKINETYFRPVELIRFYMRDHRIGINHLEKTVIDENYDLEKLHNIQYNNQGDLINI